MLVSGCRALLARLKAGRAQGWWRWAGLMGRAPSGGIPLMVGPRRWWGPIGGGAPSGVGSNGGGNGAQHMPHEATWCAEARARVRLPTPNM